ncbi:MAG TPA: flagellar type III secretion system pore protein FliP [Kofleriaceae bacterium]|nr:flagellar type III secretion system pore protein FliP [Kofleriaceae bacterium]
MISRSATLAAVTLTLTLAASIGLGGDASGAGTPTTGLALAPAPRPGLPSPPPPAPMRPPITPSAAAAAAAPSALDRVAGTSGPSSAIQVIALLTLASLAPALILVCTCFTRFAVVFSFLRTGLGTQGAPPTQVMIGLALFMTLFVMAPIGAEVYRLGIRPYLDGQLSETQAVEAATPPLRDFLVSRARPEDLSLFYDISDAPRPATVADVPLRIAVPAFVVSELHTAFKMGLIILLPFLVIDLVVASVLSALGMVMLPPPIVALPIKLLVFVAIDGWHMVVASLLRGAVG